MCNVASLNEPKPQRTLRSLTSSNRTWNSRGAPFHLTGICTCMRLGSLLSCSLIRSLRFCLLDWCCQRWTSWQFSGQLLDVVCNPESSSDMSKSLQRQTNAVASPPPFCPLSCTAGVASRRQCKRPYARLMPK
jgi:hypothetical protein